VIHIQYQAAAYAMHPAVNLLPRRLRRLGASRPTTVTTFHDLKVPYLFPKAGPVRRWAIDEMARQSDAVITTNQADYESLCRRLASPPAMIPIGSNIRPALPAGYDRDAWRARWGARPGDLLLSFFGFINDRKGVDILLHTLKLLVTGDPQAPKSETGALSNPQLLMIGGQTGSSDPTNVAYLAQIQALIATLGQADRVHWTGYIPAEEVTACFVAADLCVLPFRDGVSLLHGTLHAALAHGVPIVTTHPAVPIPDLVDGSNICLVPREHPAALADAIRRLAVAPDLRQALGRGANALSERFRWDKIASATTDLYSRALMSRR
jgi:glycosyltransferase involved in cell wall biosynthesis